jgi:hypothetical protein
MEEQTYKKPKNYLTDRFYLMPETASMTLKKKELTETLLATDGYIISRGRIKYIKSKHLGAGVYLVFLEDNILHDTKK